jgi:hypothetical protein
LSTTVIRCGVIGAADELQTGVRQTLGTNHLNDHLCAARPLVTLQPFQLRAFLQIRNHDDAANARQMFLFVCVLERISRGRQRVAQCRSIPTRFRFLQTFHGLAGLLAFAQARPLAEVDEWTRLLIESEHRRLIARTEFFQNTFRALHGLVPQILPLHARACIHQHDYFRRTLPVRQGRHRAFDEWSREAQRQQTDHKTAQNQ